MNILIMLLQCGAFIIIPLVTLIIGAWKITYFKEKYQYFSMSALIGFVFFEGSLIGMIIDPRSRNSSFSNMLFIAFIIGSAATLFVFLLTPIYAKLLHLFKKQ